MFKRKRRRSSEFKKNSQVIDFEEARATRREKRETLVNELRPVRPARKARPTKHAAKKLNRKRNFYAAMLIIIIAVVGFSVFNIVSVNKQLADAVAQKESLMNEKDQLTKDLQSTGSDEYIEEQARTLLKMIRPGDIYYVVPDDAKDQ